MVAWSVRVKLDTLEMSTNSSLGLKDTFDYLHRGLVYGGELHDYLYLKFNHLYVGTRRKRAHPPRKAIVSALQTAQR